MRQNDFSFPGRLYEAGSLARPCRRGRGRGVEWSGGNGPDVCAPVCVCVKHAGSGCPVKLNGACRVSNEPVLAGGLTHSDLPLCTSLSHLGCQGMAVNLSLS